MKFQHPSSSPRPKSCAHDDPESYEPPGGDTSGDEKKFRNADYLNEGVGLGLTEDETREVMDGEPGVQAGIFVYDTHPTRSFPGDALPA
ncbi:hypothetical protein [Microbacterium sp. P5_E9]